jgi:hypothetical protein
MKCALAVTRCSPHYPPMSSPYPDEALDYPVMGVADVIRHDLDDTLSSNDASETHGLYALALALAWRLQSFPITERAILCEGLAGLIRVNALDLGEGP